MRGPVDRGQEEVNGSRFAGDPDDINTLSGRIIGAAMAVHRALGPGLLESPYESCMAIEMTERGLAFSQQHQLLLDYKGQRIRSRLRPDFIVENRIIVDIKAIDQLHPIHTAQMLTYLKLTGLPLGLLLNFNVRVLKAGIRRVAHGLPDPLPQPHLHDWDRRTGR